MRPLSFCERQRFDQRRRRDAGGPDQRARGERRRLAESLDGSSDKCPPVESRHLRAQPHVDAASRSLDAVYSPSAGSNSGSSRSMGSTSTSVGDSAEALR